MTGATPRGWVLGFFSMSSGMGPGVGGHAVGLDGGDVQRNNSKVLGGSCGANSGCKETGAVFMRCDAAPDGADDQREIFCDSIRKWERMKNLPETSKSARRPPLETIIRIPVLVCVRRRRAWLCVLERLLLRNRQRLCEPQALHEGLPKIRVHRSRPES